VIIPKVFSAVNIFTSLFLRVRAPFYPESESLTFCTLSMPTALCSTSTHLWIVLRIPTNNLPKKTMTPITYVQFPAHHSRDPRHAHAPPSLAS
jgi:hypothetical protein